MILPNPKNPPFRSKPYLEWLRRQEKPEFIYGHGPMETHHLKVFGSTVGMKPPDNHCLPIPQSTHRRLHGLNSSERQVLCEETGYTVTELRELCDGYYQRWLKEKGK